MPVPGHGHMDQAALLAGQLAEFSCCLVTEHGIRAHPVQCRPDHGFAARPPSEGGINTRMSPPPVPGQQTRPDGPGTNPSFQRLSPAEHAMLEFEYFLATPRDFRWHVPRLIAAASSSQTDFATCG